MTGRENADVLLGKAGVTKRSTTMTTRTALGNISNKASILPDVKKVSDSVIVNLFWSF